MMRKVKSLLSLSALGAMMAAASLVVSSPASAATVESQPNFAGYWNNTLVPVSAIGGQWTLPDPPPATADELSGRTAYGSLAVWVGVQGQNYLAQAGTATHENPGDLVLNQPNPQFAWWENYPAGQSGWPGAGRQADMHPGDIIGAYLLAGSQPGTWRAWVEDLTAKIGWTVAIHNSTQGQADSPTWVAEDSNGTHKPVQPVTAPITMDRLTLNGQTADLNTLAAVTMTQNQAPNPVLMSTSAPSRTGDGFSVQDGTTAPPPPPANPTPGESVDVVFPSAWRSTDGTWHFTAQPGQSLTILGGGFGSSGTVTWNGVPLTVSQWSSGVILATVPTNTTPGAGDLTVTPAGGQATAWGSTLTVTSGSSGSSGSGGSGASGSSGSSGTSSTQPSWNAPPSSLASNRTLTLTGSNLGTGGTARWHGRFPWTVVSWTPTAVTLQVPPKAHGSGHLVLTPQGESAYPMALTIAGPTITPPDHAVGTNQLLILHGSNLGTRGTARWRGRFSWKVQSWSATTVAVIVPFKAHGSGILWVHPASGPAIPVRLHLVPTL